MDMKHKVRKVHIDGKEWLWSVRGQRGSISITSPDNDRTRVDLKKFLTWKGVKDPDYWIEMIYYSITPGDIKRYIQEFLV